MLNKRLKGIEFTFQEQVLKPHKRTTVTEEFNGKECVVIEEGHSCVSVELMKDKNIWVTPKALLTKRELGEMLLIEEGELTWF